MTDDRTVEPEPIDRTVTAAIDAAESALAPTSEEQLMAGARRARDRATTRRRRTVGALVGVAAALVLVVAGVAITLARNGSDEQLVASQSAPPESTTPAGVRGVSPLSVEPSTGLADGQQVQVTVHGGFDVNDRPIRVMQCVRLPAGNYACDPDPHVYAPSIPREDTVAGSSTLTVHSALTGLSVIEPGATASRVTTRPAEQRTASCRVSSPRRLDDADVAGDPGEASTSSPESDRSTTNPSTTPSEQAAPCFIVAFGSRNGKPATLAIPIWFGGDGPNDDDTGASPIQPKTPTTNPSATPSLPVAPGDARERCPNQPAPLPTGSPLADDRPFLDFTPTEVIVCNYQGGSETGGYVLADPAKLTRIRNELNALEAPSPDQECTLEMGPTVAVIALDGSRTETVWLQLYGCGKAYRGDQVRVGAKALSWLHD